MAATGRAAAKSFGPGGRREKGASESSIYPAVTGLRRRSVPAAAIASMLPAGSRAVARMSGRWHADDVHSRGPLFIAYAAHELRGEITLQLALAEVALADPNADTATLREMGEGVVVACARQERLLEALLSLARSDYGQLPREPVDLAATAADVLRANDHHELTSTRALQPARTTGCPPVDRAPRGEPDSRTPSATTFRAAGSTSPRTPPPAAPSSPSRTPDR